jgi:hypothetical protein
MVLFESKTRNDLRWKLNQETAYTFYDRTGRKKFEEVRARLNVWFKNYPDSHKAWLKHRMIEESWDGAFFELYLHEVFYQKGYAIAVVEKLDNLQSLTPDYKITKDGKTFYLEATVVTSDDDTIRLKKHKDIVKEAIETIEPFGFWLHVEKLDILTNKSFSKRILKKELQRHIQVFSQLQSIEEIPVFHFEDELIRVVIGFLKFEKSAPDPYQKIGMHSDCEAIWGDGRTNIQKAILKKAKKYKDLEYPLIVALNFQLPMGLSRDAVESAIFGLDRERSANNCHSLSPQDLGILNGPNSKYTGNLAHVFVTSVTSHHKGSEEILEFDLLQ